MPVYICAVPWMSNRSREVLLCDSHEDTEQDFAKLLRKDVPVFLASCPESPALRAGEGTTAKIIHREASSRE